MARKFTLKSRTAAGDIDFSADLNAEQLAVATAVRHDNDVMQIAPCERRGKATVSCRDPMSYIKSNERYTQIPLVIVSTEGAERDRHKGMSLGADAYLVKPFEPEDFRQVVTDLLARDGEAG